MKHEFCDHCPGCRPAFINSQTGEVLSDDDPMMIIVNKIWNKETTYEMRKAFIEVTLHSSQDRNDLLLANQVVSKFKEAIG
jgi:hypothetical protein